MNKLLLHRIGVVATLLVLAAAGAVLATDDDAEPDQEAVLIGQLDVDEVRNFVLIEKESGERVLLDSSANLEIFVGATVRVVGVWAQDADGESYLMVREVRQSA